MMRDFSGWGYVSHILEDMKHYMKPIQTLEDGLSLQHVYSLICMDILWAKIMVKVEYTLTYGAAPPLDWCPLAPYRAQYSQRWLSVVSPQWTTVGWPLLWVLPPTLSHHYRTG